MTLKVELGFVEAGASAPFFTLDSAERGILDGTAFVLGGGEALVNVSAYVRDVNIQRGKSRELDRYQAGQASVNFNNTGRVFDPTFEASPFFGQIVPQRRIRITLDGVIQFDGFIDDWGLEYDPSGYSIATATAFDAFAQLANLVNETALVRPAELTGARINAVLNAVGFSATSRDIDTGQSILSAQTIPVGTNVLSYLQLISDSEPGDIFVNKAGQVDFRARNSNPTNSPVVFSDVSGIGYQNVKVVYGSELLFNNILITSTGGSASASDEYSIGLYGQRDLELDLLTSSQLQYFADALLNRYKNPEFRFESLSTNLDAITTEQRTDCLELDLSNIIKVEFTPGNSGPAIERFGKVLTLNYFLTPEGSAMSVGLEGGQGQLLILDDLEFGKLDESVLAW